MDSAKPEQKANKNHKHRTSCTWPYQSPDRDLSAESRKSDAGIDSVDRVASEERERLNSGSSYGSPNRGRRNSTDRSKSPRAPSAKVKEKSRTKSPRAKSPPLVAGETDIMVDKIIQQQQNGAGGGAGGGGDGANGRPPDDDAMNDIIEKKWREVSPQVMASLCFFITCSMCKTTMQLNMSVVTQKVSCCRRLVRPPSFR